jgi:hypothetical protein
MGNKKIEVEIYTAPKFNDELSRSVPRYDVTHDLYKVLVPAALSSRLQEIHTVVDSALRGYEHVGKPERAGEFFVNDLPSEKYNISSGTKQA